VAEREISIIELVLDSGRERQRVQVRERERERETSQSSD